ncbi:toll/interleukin-1 receptor domain-containing protein [Mycobacterium sp. 852002-51057_SCH5723018]|uniref:toll/interleukin-1 receptor domain-containing protein n=1 Tax=Mycobacterium sp. 852002-51057_SCH5723018 TaxID=1834094 RepID=UPI0009EF23A7|nr:toll/interleukin-1 receptor domain-containing protein [Mycobacterium sp. 852002-51057_SCH5723018]
MHLAATELPSGFWSYVHKDNDAEHGRILRLCDALKDEFGLLTARNLDLFTDRSGIAWGHKWRETIDNALNETTFFIAVVTPRYILSEECRRELLIFSQNVRAQGVPELLCPILYADVDGLDENSDDEVKAAIAKAQYEPFIDLRLVDEQSSEYRQAVNGLAVRLIDIANGIAAKETEVPAPVAALDENRPSGGEDVADEPGLIDAATAMARLFPEWQQTVEHLVGLINETGEIATDTSPKITAAGADGPIAVSEILHEYASKMGPIAKEFRDTGTLYATQSVTMNANILPILNQLKKTPASELIDPVIYDFLESIISLADAGEEAETSVREFQQSAQSIYGLSRVVRPPLELLSEGAQRFLDGQALLDEWKRRAEEILAEHPRRDGAGT